MNFQKIQISEKQIRNFLTCSYGIPTNHPFLHPIASHISELFRHLREMENGHPGYVEFAWQNYNIIYGITVADLWLDRIPDGYHSLNFDKMCRLTTHLHTMILRHM